MRLFKRKSEPEPTPCPRCGQFVADESGPMCPMCGWDVHDAYQGPTLADESGRERAGARAGGWDDTG